MTNNKILNVNKTIDNIKNQIECISHTQYINGVDAVLKVFNERFLLKVWHKKDAEKFFDEVLDTLRELNCEAIRITREYENNRKNF